jgi:hypothetical protein
MPPNKAPAVWATAKRKMSKEPNVRPSVDPEVDAFIEDEKAEKSKRRPTRRAANETRGMRLREVRKLRTATEEEARKALIDAGLTGESLTEMMRVWRVYRNQF